MNSLTQIAITSRKAIRYTIFGIIGLTVGRIIWGFSVQTYLKIFPPGPPPPTVKYGRLTKINFPEIKNDIKLSFTVETATGGLPENISTQAKVYFMPKLNSNLLALDTSKAKAQQIGFNDPNPVQISDTVYKFLHPSKPAAMEMNIVTGNFSISYDLASDRTPLDNKPPPAEVAASNFKAFLTAAGILPADLTGPIVPKYFSLQSGGLTPVLALSEADVTRVNLYRKPYDKLPSVTAKPREGNVWSIVSGASEKSQQLIAAEFHYFPVDETQFSTYPILNPSQAFKELSEGKAFVASVGKYKDGDSLKIRSVYLAYFDSGVPSDFYQPVYVFDSGENDPDNSFVAYVPAVTSEYYPRE